LGADSTAALDDERASRQRTLALAVLVREERLADSIETPAFTPKR
jgi:hypothetical protein